MNQSKQVRISGETLEKLKTVGQPFESIDDCLKRVLGCSCVTTEMKQGSELDEESDKESKLEAAAED